ncbi:Uma2 family endonuclease [Planctomycetes bacterium TBK1r]|uniref:Uncharacterized protein n=1 Tax=Stieleria magnilauensis TaxID=2527963 RepID=A0ABX5XUJ6_9BACT|nr:hypothetical protein TBK1r_46240 [Planctomycetes bacterium TBK1r]
MMSTQSNDRGFKQTLYREQGVGTYLIVDPIGETVQRIQRSDPACVSIATSQALQLAVCETCEIEVEPSRFFPKHRKA